MKKIIAYTTALSLLLPAAAFAQSNDSISNGSAPNAVPATPLPPMSTGTGNDAAPPGASTTGSAMKSSTMAKLSMQDTHFIRMAAMSGMAEVNDGNLAESKGNAAVKQIGTQMVTDHTKANQQLMQIASAKGVTPPTEPSAADRKATAKLKGMSGAAFDKAYLTNQVKAHETAISLFKTEAATGSDADLKSFASSTLPTLQQHLSMIQAAMK